MAKVKIQGHVSGTGILTVTAPNTSTDRTITLPDSTGTLLTADGDGSSLTGVGVDGISSSADATAITIDSNEQVTMGGTTLYAGQGNTATGQHFENTGTGYLSRTGGYALGLNRNTSDGTIINFARQGSSVGSIDASTSGISIKLGGTAAANALDDYEEGTWTPVWTPDGGTIVTNTTYTGGVYTKVGNLVTVHCRLYTNNVSSPTGKITISGLPYTIKNSPYATPYVTWPLLGLNGSLAGEPRARALGNTTTLQLSDWVWGTTESGSNIADKFDADVWCHAGLTYMTN